MDIQEVIESEINAAHVMITKPFESKGKPINPQRGNPSQKSIEGYQKIFNAQFRKLSVWQKKSAEELVKVAKATKSKNTWFTRKAALTAIAKSEINKIILAHVSLSASNQTLLLSNEYPNNERESKLEDLRYYSNLFSAVENEPLPDKTEKVKSKKDVLRHLPENWRELVIDEIVSYYKTQALVCALTGCRPEELRSGILLEIDERGLVATIIKGAKVTKHSGQETRQLIFSLKSYLTLELSKIIADEGKDGKLFVKLVEDDFVGKTKFTKAINAAAKRAIINLKKGISVSAYCFRHQFAADIKSSFNTSESSLKLIDLAGALGHCVDETQAKYGHIKQSKSSTGSDLVKVIVPSIVRQRTPPDFSSLPEGKNKKARRNRP